MNILVSVGSAGLPRDRSPSAIKRPHKHNKYNFHSDVSDFNNNYIKMNRISQIEYKKNTIAIRNFTIESNLQI